MWAAAAAHAPASNQGRIRRPYSPCSTMAVMVACMGRCGASTGPNSDASVAAISRAAAASNDSSSSPVHSRMACARGRTNKWQILDTRCLVHTGAWCAMQHTSPVQQTFKMQQTFTVQHTVNGQRTIRGSSLLGILHSPCKLCPQTPLTAHVARVRHARASGTLRDRQQVQHTLRSTCWSMAAHMRDGTTLRRIGTFADVHEDTHSE